MDIHVILSVTLTLLSIQAENCLEEQQCSNCSRRTGYCTTDCFPGYFGLKCKSLCSKNCKHSNCHQTGTGISRCSDGCVPGFQGITCNVQCQRAASCTKCPQGCDGTFCHLTSSCISGCHDSYFGANCKTCSRRCHYCNRITGRCDVCHDPYFGQDCQFSCENCSTTNCVQACAPGLYGHTCSKRCSKNCLAYSTANTTLTSNSSTSCISECQRSNGECIHGCVDGWSGLNCSLKIQWEYTTSTPDNNQCSSNCMGCNGTGVCVEGCLPGYYGYYCKPCSETCFNHTCHPKNGSCDNGCIQGQYGQFCKLSCINCPEDACHPSTGICAEETKGSHVSGPVVGLSTACILLIVGTVGILVFLYHRYRKPSSTERGHGSDVSLRPGSSRQVETEYYTLHRYWDIEDYDEVSQRPDQQQGLAEEDNNSCPVLPVLAVHFPGALDTEDNISDPVLPVLPEYIARALDTEDNSGDTSCSSASGSQSYTHLMGDVIVGDPRTIVTYISPTEDNT